MNNNPSIVRFLQAWANNPIPQHILDEGAEIMGMEEYTPEKRVHRIVKKCVMLWIEHDAAAMTKDGSVR